MENDELLLAIQDKIKLGVIEGMGAHIQEKHAPLEERVGKLQGQIQFWKGALWVIGASLTLAVAALAAK